MEENEENVELYDRRKIAVCGAITERKLLYGGKLLWRKIALEVLTVDKNYYGGIREDEN